MFLLLFVAFVFTYRFWPFECELNDLICIVFPRTELFMPFERHFKDVFGRLFPSPFGSGWVIAFACVHNTQHMRCDSDKMPIDWNDHRLDDRMGSTARCIQMKFSQISETKAVTMLCCAPFVFFLALCSFLFAWIVRLITDDALVYRKWKEKDSSLFFSTCSTHDPYHFTWCVSWL